LVSYWVELVERSQIVDLYELVEQQVIEGISKKHHQKILSKFMARQCDISHSSQ
jgi:hypothetical protein